VSIVNWKDIPETMITPGYSVARGKTIYGNMLLLQQVEFRGNVPQVRKDGEVGANMHFHPEEQIFIILKNKLNIRFGGKVKKVEGDNTHFDPNKMEVESSEQEWQSAGPGEVCYIPAYTLHEASWEGGYGLTYSVKARIPGHSWYDESWQPGARDDWERHFKNFRKLNEKYKETVPWDKVIKFEGGI